MKRYITPHSRHQHLFVVARAPKDPGPEGLTLEQVYLTKAFETEELAEEEVKRLSAVNGEHWQYVVMLVRLVKGEAETA
jgi:hypothetical protein